jgi:hypothetical protein
MTAEANAARLHVTFGYSAAGSLKMALAMLRISEEVAVLGDDNLHECSNRAARVSEGSCSRLVGSAMRRYHTYHAIRFGSDRGRGERVHRGERSERLLWRWRVFRRSLVQQSVPL